MQDNNVFNPQSLGMESVVSTNKVLKNTYMLLGMTLLFSAVTAGISMAMGLSHGAGLVLSLVGFGLLFVVHKMADTSKGLLAVSSPSPACHGRRPSAPCSAIIWQHTKRSLRLVMQALGGTALVFFGLSAYALTTRKDFSFMGGFLMVGLLVALVAIIANIFLQIPALQLTSPPQSCSSCRD